MVATVITVAISAAMTRKPFKILVRHSRKMVSALV
jgi:hypothetical protein